MNRLAELNELPAEEFVARLAGIFEHSPWVAQRVAASRPFDSRLALFDAMRSAVDSAAAAEQLGLIRAHPRLSARGRRAELTQASAQEQRRAGLEGCTEEQAQRLDELNAAYFDKFDMPFILAVRGHDPASIIATCTRRLGNDAQLERRTCLGEIARIGAFRLADAVATPAGAEILAMQLRLAALRDRGPAERAELVREWMLAADLEVSADDLGGLLGRRRSTGLNAWNLLVGLHYDSTAHAPRYDGHHGYLVGIAVAQQIRQQGIRLPFDLLVFAHPADERSGDLSGLADPDALRGCVALAADDLKNLDGALMRAALRAAYIDTGSHAIVRQGPSISHRVEAAQDVQLYERAAQTLQDFLLQNRQTATYDA